MTKKVSKLKMAEEHVTRKWQFAIKKKGKKPFKYQSAPMRHATMARTSWRCLLFAEMQQFLLMESTGKVYVP